MFGIDSGNGYSYGEDETVVIDIDKNDKETRELFMDSPAPSGASSNNL